jgi:transcriptional regulator GlxA family with amidase domain
MQVFTIASNTNPITTFEGLKILPDYSYKDPNLPSIDVLVVASAKHSMDSDLENKEMIEWVRQTGSNAIYTISLCDGAFVVAKAGLADGKVTTTFPSDIPRYREMFPHLEVMEAVSFVHDENLITSAGGVKSYDVAMYLVEKLYGNQVASNIGAGLIIDWNLDKVPHFVNNRP